MKTNLPVSAGEVPFPRGCYLDSRTGRIGATACTDKVFARPSDTLKFLIGNFRLHAE